MRGRVLVRMLMLAATFVFATFAASCANHAVESQASKSSERPSRPSRTLPPNSESPPVQAAGAKQIGPNVFIETVGDKRRVLVKATVCLQAGVLEFLLTRTVAGKQHESILAADIDARHLHTALLLCAQPGKPVQYFNEKNEADFRSPTGDKIKITLEYQDKGKTVRVPAQRWVRDIQTKKPLAHDWVFAGSFLVSEPGQKEQYYAANDGMVICVSNFTSALLDLPVASSDKEAELLFEANSDIVPPLGTPVTVILEKAEK